MDWFFNRVVWDTRFLIGRSLVFITIYVISRIWKELIMYISKSLLPTPSEAFYVRFWMMHHGGRTSKRSIFWGNVSTMMGLDKGKLSRHEKEKKTTIRTTRDLAVCCFILSS